MKKLHLKVEWKTNEYYDVDELSLLLTDETLTAIKKSQDFLKANPDVDSIRVKVDDTCIATMNDYRIGVGFVIVRAGDNLYFMGQDNFDSSNQIETQEFTIDGEVITYPDL